MKKTAILLLSLLMTVWAAQNVLAYTGPGGLREIKLYRGDFDSEEISEETELIVEYIATGTVNVWNSRDTLQVRVVPNQELIDEDQVQQWLIRKISLYVGADPVPVDAAGAPDPSLFPYQAEYETPQDLYRLVINLEQDMGFRWGEPYEDLRKQNVCAYATLVKVETATGRQLEIKDVWTFDPDYEADIAAGAWDVIEIGSGRLKKNIKINKGEAVRNRVAIMRGLLKQALLDHAGATVYEMAHPRPAHFIDSPVAGLNVETPTFQGKTDSSGSFDYFPGERADLLIGDVYLGNALADHKFSPVDVFEGGDMDDNRVINMAWLLQCLDADGDPSKGIDISEAVAGYLDTALSDLNLITLDFNEETMVEAVIDKTILLSAENPDLNLTKVSVLEAKGHLDKSLNGNMFRKNMSQTPVLVSAKAKLNNMGVWFPALKANGEPASYIGEFGSIVEGIPYYDEDGDLIRVADKAKPLVAVYTDEVAGAGAGDVFAAVSRDDGHTWKRKNISRMAGRSSFTLANGEAFPGDCKKPVFQVKGNKILIAWTSKYARGGKPRYAIRACPEGEAGCITCTGSGDNEKCEEDYPWDDPYIVDDFWGVSGPQRSVDYTTMGYPEEGEVPYSAVWTCRGVIVTQAEIDKGGWWAGKAIGDIVWFKPERLTSGRRDANQVFMGAADGAGFAITWQEDPKGLRPGEAKGPGPGWGGATANHKTDIWYSYITWNDHSEIDENFVAGGDPEHPVQYDDEGNAIDWTNRPKALRPMSLPVRISDNDAVNTNNATLLDSDGNPINAIAAADITYQPEALTRCVKFQGGATITTPDDPDGADYIVLRAAPADHSAAMNCTSCHVPYGLEPKDLAPTQAAPIPLVVAHSDAGDLQYLGGFTNADCVSCHYGHIVPRDRVIAVPEELRTTDENETARCEWCEQVAHGIWKDGFQEGGEIIEAYYPYVPYPYFAPDLDDTRDGSHRYITEVNTTNFSWLKQDLWALNPTSFNTWGTTSGDWGTVGLKKKINYQGAERTVAITTDGRLLDGNTAATRPNLFMQTYTKPDGTKSAWAIMAYEESKGMGSGPSETAETGDEPQDGSGYDPYATVPDEGKNVIYHSFDFTQPDLVSCGTILNLPETDDNGAPLYVQEPEYLGSDPIYDADGNITGYTPIPNPDYVTGEENYILDWKGDPQLAYENARRPRFILQSKAAAFGGTKPDGTFKEPGNSGTVLIVLYKEGEEGAGRPSDIMARRCVVAPDQKGNPWDPDNFLTGVQNISTVMPGTTWVNPDRDPEAKGDGTKVCEWIQPKECLGWKSGRNPYEDARAHRGAIRGDFVILGYSYCPNWAASRKAHDKYDLYIRRSFDGGRNWTTDPAATDAVVHTDYFFDPEGISGLELDAEGNDASSPTKHYTVETPYEPGQYEPARNVSLIKNNKVSVIEPRIVAVPGTIKDPATGEWTGKPEDKQDPNCFYIAYGTSTNLPDVEKAPEDLYLSFSQDRGTTFFEDEWVVNPDSLGNHAGETVRGWIRLAKGDAQQGEVQIRMTPDGSRFYAVWLEEGIEGSDILFRRLAPGSFKVNNRQEKQTDDDGDGFAEYQGDCDDAEGGIYPGAVEVCGDGIDQNCDGLDPACPVE